MARVVVGTTSAALLPEERDPTPGSSVQIKNTGTVTVFLEIGAPATTTDGYPLAAGEWISADLGGRRDALHGRVATGSGELRILRSGA